MIGAMPFSTSIIMGMTMSPLFRIALLLLLMGLVSTKLILSFVMLALVFGWFTEKTQATDATGLNAVGAVALVMGVAVLYLRSLHKEE